MQYIKFQGELIITFVGITYYLQSNTINDFFPGILGFALNSILIDERLGYTGKENENIRRFAIIPPSAPTLKNVLSRNSYEVGLYALTNL